MTQNHQNTWVDDEGRLNIELMRKLYHVIAYNLAKSRAAKDGNKYRRENYFPKTKVAGNLVQTCW